MGGYEIYPLEEALVLMRRRLDYIRSLDRAHSVCAHYKVAQCASLDDCMGALEQRYDDLVDYPAMHDEAQEYLNERYPGWTLSSYYSPWNGYHAVLQPPGYTPTTLSDDASVALYDLDDTLVKPSDTHSKNDPIASMRHVVTELESRVDRSFVCTRRAWESFSRDNYYRRTAISGERLKDRIDLVMSDVDHFKLRRPIILGGQSFVPTGSLAKDGEHDKYGHVLLLERHFGVKPEKHTVVCLDDLKANWSSEPRIKVVDVKALRHNPLDVLKFVEASLPGAYASALQRSQGYTKSKDAQRVEVSLKLDGKPTRCPFDFYLPQSVGHLLIVEESARSEQLLKEVFSKPFQLVDASQATSDWPKLPNGYVRIVVGTPAQIRNLTHEQDANEVRVVSPVSMIASRFNDAFSVIRNSYRGEDALAKTTRKVLGMISRTRSQPDHYLSSARGASHKRHRSRSTSPVTDSPPGSPSRARVVPTRKLKASKPTARVASLAASTAALAEMLAADGPPSLRRARLSRDFTPGGVPEGSSLDKVELLFGRPPAGGSPTSGTSKKPVAPPAPPFVSLTGRPRPGS